LGPLTSLKVGVPLAALARICSAVSSEEEQGSHRTLAGCSGR
jgi:hypothetical protein